MLAVQVTLCHANLMKQLGHNPPSELYIATDPLMVAQELQLTIADAPRDNTRIIAQDAIDVLGDVRALHGATKVAIHALSAFIVNRKMTIEEQILGCVQFPEITVKGVFGGFQYVENSFLRSLCVDLYDVTVLEPVEPNDPDKGLLKTPLIVPVHAVERVWPMN